MKTAIVNARIVNEGIILEGDVIIENDRIAQIGSGLSTENCNVIDAGGKYLIPGVIDSQVHFREPGLTHKAELATETRAAVAGGTTSFFDMPNTKPQAVTQEELEKKYVRASNVSLANYSFYMGATNDNLEEVLKTDPAKVCGIKVFMGSSTGNMLVDDEKTLEGIFGNSTSLIATHCEKEEIVRRNEQIFKEKYGDSMPMSMHPDIRSVEACFESSKMAVGLARKHNARLHVLHLTTAEELVHFDNTIPVEQKRITSEACVHHLWFSKDDYETKGSYIKCNPAVKEKRHREALFQGLLDNKLDLIATDHAPHTKEEKAGNYWTSPSGLPLVQHSLQAVMQFVKQGKVSIDWAVNKMCHCPAIVFKIQDRGYIREGYFADLVLLDDNKPYTVNEGNILSKCGWSPFDGETFSTTILKTFVSGNLVYDEGKFNEIYGQRLAFSSVR